MTRLTKESRIRGSLLGGAIGDALGGPVEFMSGDEIEERFGRAGVRTFQPMMIDGHERHQRIVAYTKLRIQASKTSRFLDAAASFEELLPIARILNTLDYQTGRIC